MQGDAYPRLPARLHSGFCAPPKRVPVGFHAERAAGGRMTVGVLHAGRHAHRDEGLAPSAL
jgi:hypothetical protein